MYLPNLKTMQSFEKNALGELRSIICFRICLTFSKYVPKTFDKNNLDSTCLRFVVQTGIKIRVRIQSRQSMFFLAVKIVHGKIGNCLDNNWRNLTTSRSNGFQAFFINIGTTF